MKTETKYITRAQWIEEGKSLFGDDMLKWRFVCPSCGGVFSVQKWKDVGASKGEVAFSCPGRHMKDAHDAFTDKSPCNYAGGGLFRLNPVTVMDEGGVEHQVFDFDRTT